MKKLIISALIIVLLVGCSPLKSQEYINLDSTKIALEKVLNQVNEDYFALQSATPVVVIKLITQTPTATPKYTPTPRNTPTVTNTPTNTFTPTPTVDPLKMMRGDGFYLIGIDIAPGVWRSQGSGDGCYWAVTRTNGDIIDNHFGMSGGTAYIPAYGFQVEFDDCGMWVFISNP
jgi:hypothetical protein